MDFLFRRGASQTTPPDRGTILKPEPETTSGPPKVDDRELRLPYLPGLDGLRAFSVLAVLLYHAGVAFMPGGFLGVEVFFVISGYLITLMLISESGLEGQVSLKKFWLRRARRLLPALFTLLATVLIIAVLFLPDEVAKLRGEVLAAFGYVTNWYQILNEQSYFETIGRPSLLQHLWSLAVEEQFYIIFPIIFALTVKRWQYKVLPYIIIGALASTMLMMFLYSPDKDPSRIYYGTDTRATGLLIGVALAFVWWPWLNQKKLTQFYEFLLNLTGFIALAALLWYFTAITEFNSFLYTGGFLLVSVTTAVLIAVTVHPQSIIFSGFLSLKPLLWFGLRSYSIYLWHWPVFVLTRPQLDIRLDGFALLVLRFAITFALAEISYRFIEIPVRKGVLSKWWKQWHSSKGKQRGLLSLRWGSVGGAILVSGLIFGTAAATAKLPPTPAYLATSPNLSAVLTPLAVATVTPTIVQAVPTPTAIDEVAPILATPAPLPTTLPKGLPPGHVLAIGDSVMMVVTKDLQKTFESIEIDTSIGRHFPKLPAILREYKAKGKIGEVVLIHLGSNGGFDDKHVDETMEVLKDVRKVVFVNNKVPRQWESFNNTVLARSLKKYPNAVLVDWYGASINHPEYFAPDGFHPRGVGIEIYLDLLKKNLK
jgi:peptidoglycan/LPS O-acetylase OafA/YrhL